ncbi:hypothetical protein OUZ56_004155 [Daphnia magna]|uniref:MATH domain-containing protein n=1 Tax=Daphnia magna TaxID=35525 RepID=A0ABQ9YNY4_9CRUS|nr:hypothetical protein OUZ56_004155 [Daphnia magna]
MVVIEFDLPRSVSLSALDENNVTLKDFPENGGQESNKMVPRATLICRPNSHPFQERNLSLESAMKVGRWKVLFTRQFGVDVMENSRKVTHGCIVATVKLYLPDGKEAKASPSTGIQEEEDSCELGKQDLYQLNQWIQEAVIREQVLETKLGSLQRIVSATREAAEMGWTALMEEDRLLTRIESLENQLVVSSKNFHED